LYGPGGSNQEIKTLGQNLKSLLSASGEDQRPLKSAGIAHEVQAWASTAGGVYPRKWGYQSADFHPLVPHVSIRKSP
jgi:hypothetical protein